MQAARNAKASQKAEQAEANGTLVFSDRLSATPDARDTPDTRGESATRSRRAFPA